MITNFISRAADFNYCPVVRSAKDAAGSRKNVSAIVRNAPPAEIDEVRAEIYGRAREIYLRARLAHHVRAVNII